MLYKIDYRKTRGRNTVGYAFVIFGIVFLGILFATLGPSFLEPYKYDKSVTPYEVTSDYYYDNNTAAYHQRKIYYYTVNGENYSCISEYAGKEDLKYVYYNSENPYECKVSSNNNGISGSGIFIISLFFFFVPTVILASGFKNLIQSGEKTRMARKLAKSGVLVKGIPYELVASGHIVNNIPLMCISCEYTFPNGESRELKGEPLKDKLIEDTEYCDLLFDPNNYDNFFVDFEITTTGKGNPKIIYINNESISYDNKTSTFID